MNRLAVLALLWLGACTPEDETYDAESTGIDLGDPLGFDTSTVEPPESIFVMFGYMGNVTVRPADGSYRGTERFYAYEANEKTYKRDKSIADSSARILCELTWTVTGETYPSKATVPCTDDGTTPNSCNFSFDAYFGSSRATDGDLCTDLFGGTIFSHPGRRIGYIDTFRVGDNAYGDAVLMYYSGVSGSGQSYSGWYAMSGYYRFANHNFTRYNASTGEFWWDFPFFRYYQLPAP